MFNVNLDNSYRVGVCNSGEGSQVKYFKDDMWYKEDKLGEEGLVEYLVSKVLSYSSLPKSAYVIYERGKINGKNGCRSRNFLKKGYDFISLEKAYYSITGNSLYSDTSLVSSFKERRDYVLDFFKKYYNIDLCSYFSVIFSLDMITLNEDRHFNNLGILLKGNTTCFAPVFDNGLSLLNANYSVSMRKELSENVKRVSSKPFSGSPETQFKLFTKGFDIDYIGLFIELEGMEDTFYKQVLEYQLLRYKNIFFNYTLYGLYYKGKRIGTRVKVLNKYYDCSLIIKENINSKIEMVSSDCYYHSESELSGKIKVLEVDNYIISKLFNS